MAITTPTRTGVRVLWLAALLAACTSPSPVDTRTQPPLVRSEVAQLGGTTEQVYTGIVVARVQTDLGFRVPGKVTARLVDVGQAVKRGQALMRLDPTDLALAHVAQTNTVAAAQARADQTEADEKRYRELVGAGAVSASQYDQAKAAADSARAQLKAAKAEAEVAQDSVGYAVLEADSDGVVVETLAEPGQVVSAGQPVVRLAKAGPREALVNLPETLRPPIGATAMATVFGRTDQASAKLRELSDSANPLTRTFEARYVLAAPASAAPLGTTVTVALDAGGAASKVTVPLGAVTDRGDGPGVWVVHGTPTKLAWRPVKLAGLSDESATITSGLNPGDRFVSLGAHSLHADEEVRIEDGPKK